MVVIKILAIAVLVILILFCLLLFLVKPGERRIESFETEYFAHRGYHDSCVPENSKEAFKAAKDHGYGVELDVQLTKDNRLVVFHDADLERMCGVKKKIGDLTYEELSLYKFKDSNETIPLFEEVLALLEDRPVICEIKTHKGVMDCSACQPVCDAIQNYKGKVYVESFSPFVIRWFKKNRPDIIRGQLSMDFIKNREGLTFVEAIMMKNLLIHCLSRPDFIAYSHRDQSAGFWLAKTFFNPLCVAWTVRSKEEVEASKANYQAVIFEKIHLITDLN